MKVRIVTRGPTPSDESFELLSGVLTLNTIVHDGQVARSEERGFNLSEVESIELSDWPAPAPPPPPQPEMETRELTRAQFYLGPLAEELAPEFPGSEQVMLRYKVPKQPPARKARAK